MKLCHLQGRASKRGVAVAASLAAVCVGQGECAGGLVFG